MNPNHIPYGQPMPMSQPQRRHDGTYGPLPPHMRPHPGYQPYYSQQMGPMMPQYPQQYAPNWYPYQQHHVHPMPQGRPQYYQPPPMQQPPHYPQHNGPLVVSSQPQHMHQSPRPQYPPPSVMHQHPPSSTSMTSTTTIQIPPSPPLSTSTSVSARKDFNSHPGSPAPQRVQSPIVDPVTVQERFFPPVPWLSVDGDNFPPRAARQKRRVLRSTLANEPIVYPLPEIEFEAVQEAIADAQTPKAQQTDEEKTVESHTVPIYSQTSTPLPSDTPSDAVSTQPTTPSSVAPAMAEKVQQTPTQPKSRPILPIIPAVPVLPQSPTTKRPQRDSMSLKSPDSTSAVVEARRGSTASTSAQSEQAEAPLDPSKSAAAPSQPKSWANLFRPTSGQAEVMTVLAPTPMMNGIMINKTEALSDVLNEVSVVPETPSKIAFLSPRGLVNTGNMCYMNSVLQVLVFCIPFYDFLSKVAKRAAHTFRSDTPLIDAIILFVQEYPVIDSATSVEQLRLRLKPADYEKYGDSFIPEYVYSAIKQLPRFREMRRGHQQDAQEFLGFLLEELHEECARAMRSGTANSSGRTTPLGSAPSISEQADKETGWMEVGHKQKPAVTRSSGAIATESPVTNIFGGKLRSELKISGNKLSVTLEPYSPLQLDIGSPDVNNIIDALKGLTRPESMQGEFQSARGQRTSATKQVFIETLPPVLILHLKRFQYDSTTNRAEKIWKKVGYPLELELPKEIFPVTTRNRYAAHGGLPKYRLTGVIYHHGKNANGGHYTVDIRRQDGYEWIRIDDTLIRRIRNEDVAEGGSEEDPKVLAAALERHKQGKNTGNRFDQIDQDDEDDDQDSDKVWNQVNGHSRSKSSASAIVNGSATPAKASHPQTPREKYSVKDNKVAYLLFYQRVSA